MASDHPLQESPPFAPHGRPPNHPVLASLCLVEALALGLFAWSLPWRLDGVMHGGAVLVVGAYVAGSVACLLPTRLRPRLLRFAAWASLGSFVGLFLQLALWSAHLHRLYEALGWALTGGMAVFLCALGFFLVPLPVYLLVFLRQSPEGAAREGGVGVPPSAVGAALALLVASAPHSAWADAGDRAGLVPPATLPAVSEEVRALAAAFERTPPPRSAQGGQLDQPSAVTCESEGGITGAWAITLRKKSKAVTVCLQGNTDEKLRRIASLLKSNQGRQIKLDVLERGRALDAENSLLGALSLRPGLDGACAGTHCLLPFQMTTRREFTSYQPFQSVPEARFGVDLESLRDTLSPAEPHRLHALHTSSFVLVHNSKSGKVRVQPLLRMGPGPQQTTSKELARAQQLAERYIVAAQNEKGVYRYTLDPFGGAENYGTVSLPRHAGTTLVLCEHGKDSPRIRKAVARALQVLTGAYHVQSKDREAEVGHLYGGKGEPTLGQTALPLIALHECARRGLAPRTPMTTALARFVLGLQREDGSFSPQYNRQERRPEGDAEAVFAAGQAIYALILTEAELAEGHEEQPELLRAVRAAVDRGMAYYAGPYWNDAPAAFFYLEENWHCLAARAALSTRRSPEYERFCLDYVTFKQRLIQKTDHMGFRGGLTLSPLFSPHSTATSGFGEATAAALALAHARGERRPDLERSLRDALGYLLQIQLTPTSCFACASPSAWGGYTESPVSGKVRIDFVQHAWAAMAHGQKVLGI